MLFLPVNGYFHRKNQAAIPLGEECGLTTVIVEQPAHFSVESPIGQAF